jgi:hypothetical protein
LDREKRKASEHHLLRPVLIDDPKQNSKGNGIEQLSWHVMTSIDRTKERFIILTSVSVFRELLVASLNPRE